MSAGTAPTGGKVTLPLADRVRRVPQKPRPPDEPVFPWNDLIGMTNGSEQRAVVVALSSVFDAIQALRWDLAHPGRGGSDA